MGRRYEDAKKAFQFAFTLDPKNIQILIDLSELQIQVRDYAGYRTSKQKLIAERGSNSAYWLGFMTGAFLEGKYDLCRDIITTFRDTLEKTPSYTRQELVFLETRCFTQQQKWSEALATLERGLRDVLDEDKAKELQATLCGRLGQIERSQQLWEELLAGNPENYAYYRGLECCVLDCWSRFDSFVGMELPSDGALEETQRAKLATLLESLWTKYPRCNAIPHIQLRFLKGAAFEKVLETMLVRAMRKGIPSFFSGVKSVMRSDAGKFETLRRLATEHLAVLRAEGHLKGETSKEEPQTELWLLLLCAQIDDFAGERDAALQLLEEAYRHTPTCYDLHVLKAKVLRHKGALKEAAAAIGVGSRLDLGDRYMNTKHVKYLLRSDQIEEADRVVSYWTRKDVPDRIELNTLQANWFEIECADSYFRRGDLPHAYKMYNNVLEHFNTYVNDQFDFHGYAMRKAVISCYLDFLKAVDTIYKNKYYRRAAKGIIRCALHLEEQPLDVKAYEQQFPLFHYPKVHKKGAEYADDEDPDGIKLVMEGHLLEKVRFPANELLLFAKDDKDAMKVVQEWAEKVNDSTVLEEVKALLWRVCSDISLVSTIHEKWFWRNE